VKSLLAHKYTLRVYFRKSHSRMPQSTGVCDCVDNLGWERGGDGNVLCWDGVGWKNIHGDVRLKVKALRVHTSDLWDVTCHMGSQCCLPPDTSERDPYNPSPQTGTWLTYPGGMEGGVDLGGWLHAEMMYLPADSHPSKY